MISIKNNQGFTLVDMMFTIAIIGLLASISVPKFSRMMAKARTVEAKVGLSTIYTLEQSFMIDWNTYTVDLKNLGFQQEGSTLRYVFGFVKNGRPLMVCNNYPSSAPAERPPDLGVESTKSYNVSNSAMININGSTWGPKADFNFAITNTILLSPAPIAVCEGAPGVQFFKAYAYGTSGNYVETAGTPYALSIGIPTESWYVNSKKIIGKEGNVVWGDIYE